MDDTFAQASSQFCTDLARNRSPTNVGTITRSGADYLYSEGLNVETIETDGSTCTAKTVLTRTESSSTGQLIIERHLSFWSTYVDGWVVIQTTGPDGTVCTADFTTHGRHAGSVN